MRRLPATHAPVDPLCYPLLFPYGDPEWHIQLHSLTGDEDNTIEGNLMRSSIAREEQNADKEHMGQ